jgi:UPF0176 protein
MPEILNIAAYQFATLTDLARLRGKLREQAKLLGLRGTILLSPEGINLFIAGERSAVNALLATIRGIPGLDSLTVKESVSDSNPFSRMLVKLKREIIAFGIPGIAPEKYTSRRIAPRELKQWLDEGRDVTLVDTRNRYEVAAGTFQNAVTLPIDDFRDFPRATKSLSEDLKQRTIVTFCTGGIRCEKAAPYLEREGFQDVFQLDGGILKYFEECQNAHYQGECFVFDKRVAVDPGLAESELRLCYGCQAVLSLDDQASPLYIPGKECPHCHKPLEIKLAERNAQIAIATAVLPGSLPYDHERPITVPLRHDGLSLIEFLEAMRTHLAPAEWIAACQKGRLTRRGERLAPDSIVRAGDYIVHHLPATIEPTVSGDIRVIFEDDAVIVVNKPAPLPVHSCGRFHRNTLSYLLGVAVAPLKLRLVHRLDSDTSGVQVLAKTAQAARKIQLQFEQGQVRKKYVAKIHGHPLRDYFECQLPISREMGPGGVRVTAEEGDSAHTEFHVISRQAEGTALLEVIPHTGRTNQIRAHLWALGFPIAGDPIYQREGKLGELRSTEFGEPPLCLHAAELEFVNPSTEQLQTFEALPPEWVTA